MVAAVVEEGLSGAVVRTILKYMPETRSTVDEVCRRSMFLSKHNRLIKNG